MNDLTKVKKFATTIGAEAFARAKYEGDFPVAVTVTTVTRKGLVDRVYVMTRKPQATCDGPVGTFVK